jgi:hypothetical protein
LRTFLDMSNLTNALNRIMAWLERLGYCTISNYVAEHELKLELDEKWDEF